MHILGINAYHGDSAACLVRDGRLVAAAEEERFRRVKHWAGFPKTAIEYCLSAGGIGIGGIDHIALNRNPRAHPLRKARFVLSQRPSYDSIRRRFQNRTQVSRIGPLLENVFVSGGKLKARLHFIEHHCAHLASAFFVSPHRSADILSVDGFGDFVSTMWGTGEGSKIRVLGMVGFPHSLGYFYLAMTQFLGFKNYGDEYKLMGLAAYGKPSEIDAMRKLVRLKERGTFALGLDYFRHHREGAAMTWEDTEPRIEDGYSEKLRELLGPDRHPDEPITARHQTIAASAQAMYEEAFFHILDHLGRQGSNEALCIAGGCGMNSVANGKILRRGRYKKVYVQAAPGDAGGAIGAAFYVWNQKMRGERAFVMDHAHWGPAFTDGEAEAILESFAEKIRAAGGVRERVPDEDRLCERVAAAIAEGKVVGWFSGRMEWGPRALGARSILCDPRRPDIKDILNVKIKRRESFRPFAPSVLREAVAGWFETDADVPFMSEVFQIRAEKRALIPAVTHVDGSGRLQTVTREQNPRYHKLISKFRERTGVPLVLNTSFNENEPIVCRPEEAIECFLRTRMDMLVVNSFVVERR